MFMHELTELIGSLIVSMDGGGVVQMEGTSLPLINEEHLLTKGKEILL